MSPHYWSSPLLVFFSLDVVGFLQVLAEEIFWEWPCHKKEKYIKNEVTEIL